MIDRLRALGVSLWRRAESLEIVVGLGVLVAGVAMVSVAAAMIVFGAALLAPHVWPHVTRRR